MSYDINFRVKVEGVDQYVPVGSCLANITWNVREIITRSTGLPWLNEKNNGFCSEVIPMINKGYWELVNSPEKYKKYESPNGYGTVDGVIRFFKEILDSWTNFKRCHDEELVDVATFWVE